MVQRRLLSGAVLFLATFVPVGLAAQPAPTPSEPPADEMQSSQPAEAPGATAPPPGDPAPLLDVESVPPAETPPVAAAAPAKFSPLKVESPTATLKLGLLAQPQYEAVGSSNPAIQRVSQNLFMRRIRFLVGGTLFEDFEYFFETDFADLLKAGPDGVKSTPGMNVQDAFVTWKAAGDLLKVDVGYLLPPLAHNALQGATTLLSWDYFANSFRHSNAFFTSANPIGRDTGVQLRGLLLDGRLEYRVGAFQGRRSPPSPTDMPTLAPSRNTFRVAARLQLNLLEPESGFFYAGTYLGAKSILSVGASYDFQETYEYWAADAFLDLPLGPGTLTAQINIATWDGADWLPALPDQRAVMAEAGFTFKAPAFGPVVRFEHRDIAEQSATAPDERRLGGGIALWPYGHNINLKAFYTRVEPTPDLASYDQFNVQWQFFFF